jgi:hypothetical protein
MKTSPLLLAFALLLPSAPAAACSVGSGYHRPTNLELTEQADTILLGRVESHVPDDDHGIGLHSLGKVVVRPLILLKGPELPAEVRISGYFPREGQLAERSDPADLDRPNRNTMAGGCIRYLFDKDMLVVLFFKRRNGALDLAGNAFARSAEDVPSTDAPWVKIVRLYVEIAALPAKERRSALIERRDRLRQSSDADSKLLADDIDRQLEPEITATDD